MKRVDGHYIVHEIQHILHFEKGILYTVKEMLLQPGKSIRTFISEDRSRLVKPVIFVILTSLAYSLVTHFFHLGMHAGTANGSHSAIMAILAWIEGHYGYANMIMGIFIALWLQLFCRKAGYNFFELLIMLCFVMGTAMLLFAVFAVAEGLCKVSLASWSTLVMLVYCAWAIGQFLGGRKWTDYALALVAYVLGMVSFTVVALVAGFVIDAVTRHA
jgi:hypothetical protein